MRAVFKRNVNHAQLQLRKQWGEGGDWQQYNFGIVDNRGMTQVAHYTFKPGPAGKNSRSIVSKALAASIPEGTEYLLEFIAIGATLIARVDGILMARAQDTGLAEGRIGIYTGEPFRDLEVINLDGLPEPEARKLLGVEGR